MNHVFSRHSAPPFQPSRAVRLPPALGRTFASFPTLAGTPRPGAALSKSGGGGGGNAQPTPVAALAAAKKWRYTEPKIPIRLNSSTLIRLRSKVGDGGGEALRDGCLVDHRLVARNAVSFLKRDRRLSEHEAANGRSPFGDASFVKNVLLDVVSGRAAKAAASANPAGDGVRTVASYHRVSAFSLNDAESGCRVKVVERVSFESAAAATAVRPPPSRQPVAVTTLAATADDRRRSSSTRVAEADVAAGVRDVSTALRRATLATARKTPNGAGGAGGNADDADDEDDVDKEADDVGRRRGTALEQRKARHRKKRAVVVTGVKNCAVKFVRKASRK